MNGRHRRRGVIRQAPALGRRDALRRSGGRLGPARLAPQVESVADIGEDGAQRTAGRVGFVFTTFGGELFGKAQARALRSMAGDAVFMAAHTAAALLQLRRSRLDCPHRHLSPQTT